MTSSDVVELNFEVHGEETSPPLIILHGLFGSASNWRSIARVLSQNYRVFCLDLRNHGQSPWGDAMDYDTLAGDVAAFIKEQEIVNPVLIGHSMGGKTAMTLIQNELIPVSKSIIVDIAPVAYSHDHHDLVDVMRAIDFSTVKSRQDIDELLSGSITDPGLRGFLIQNISRDENGYRWRINLKSISLNMGYLIDYKNNNISQLEILFVAGEKSEYVEEKHHQTVHVLFPHSVVRTVEGAGHWVHAEKPQELLAVVNEFLEE